MSGWDDANGGVERTEQEELDARRWANRRKMAWQSFRFCISYSVAIAAFLIFGPESRITASAAWSPVMISVIGVFAGIVMAYIGSAAYSDVRVK